MRILIAGGAGFLGSHLTSRLLQQGHDVVALDNLLTGDPRNLTPLQRQEHGRRLTFHRADISRPLSLRGHFDAVANLASPASPRDYFEHPLETLDVGSLGTRNLLELARRDRARFLQASTSEVYGDPEIHPQVESYGGNVNPIGPRSVYDEAKRFGEALASCYAREFGLTVRIARIFNTYGPRMRLGDGRVIPEFISQALRGDPLTVLGDGLQTRSYCYVDDTVRGLDTLLWSNVEGPTNIGNPEEYTVLETAQQILALTGSRSTIVHRPAAQDDPRRRRPDITRARSTLGWEPQVPFREGLAATVRDIRHRMEDTGRGSVPASVPSRIPRPLAAHAKLVLRAAAAHLPFLIPFLDR